jgi:hypothetical protein
MALKMTFQRTFWKLSPEEKEEIEMYKKKEKTQF